MHNAYNRCNKNINARVLKNYTLSRALYLLYFNNDSNVSVSKYTYGFHYIYVWNVWPITYVRVISVFFTENCVIKSTFCGTGQALWFYVVLFHIHKHPIHMLFLGTPFRIGEIISEE